MARRGTLEHHGQFILVGEIGYFAGIVFSLDLESSLHTCLGVTQVMQFLQ